jgi:hypothetical protein
MHHKNNQAPCNIGLYNLQNSRLRRVKRAYPQEISYGVRVSDRFQTRDRVEEGTITCNCLEAFSYRVATVIGYFNDISHGCSFKEL